MEGLRDESPAELWCPACQGKLAPGDELLRCFHCDRAWPVRKGIPCFVDSDVYWGEAGITRDLMRQILQDTESRNWHEVFLNHPRPEVRKYYPFVANLERIKWYPQLGLPPNPRVLDVGAGLGTMSQALAAQGAKVFAIERVEERVQFMRLRFKQEGQSGITIVKTDLDCLPFPPQYFDLILLNGVLEWLPFSRPQENPRRAQLFYLRLLRKSLRPGGILYIGIENRMCYDLFLGAPDPHIGIPYVAVLPRIMADLLCRWKVGDRYRPYLYTHRGYRKLLAAAGYRDIEVFAALPSYAEPREIVSLSKHSRFVESYVWQTQNLLSRRVRSLALRFDILKYFAYAFAIFAREGNFVSPSEIGRNTAEGLSIEDAAHLSSKGLNSIS